MPAFLRIFGCLRPSPEEQSNATKPEPERLDGSSGGLATGSPNALAVLTKAAVAPAVDVLPPTPKELDAALYRASQTGRCSVTLAQGEKR